MIEPELLRQRIWDNKRFLGIAGILSFVVISGLFIINQQYNESYNLSEYLKRPIDSNSPIAQEINPDRLFDSGNGVTGILGEIQVNLEKFLISPTYDTILKFQ